MGEHTPGPWKIRRKDHAMTKSLDVRGEGDGAVAYLPQTERQSLTYKNNLERVWVDSGRRAEIEANARLIAAAPQMLSALKLGYQMLGVEERAHRENGEPSKADPVKGAMSVLARAIANATGTTGD